MKMQREILFICGFGTLMGLLFILSISFGPVDIPLSRIWMILTAQERSGALVQILNQVRLPRSLAAMGVGMALAASGTVLQAVMQNPLAAPSLIGVNSGAALTAMLLLAYFPGRPDLLTPATFLGALFALGLIILITRYAPGGRSTLILAGIAVSALLGAGIDTLRLLHPEAMLGATGFMIGGIAGVTWSTLRFALPWILGGLLAALLVGPLLNVISLGDEVALSLGVPVTPVRTLLLALAAILAGSSVAIAGLLGFVGLIVPHGARLLLGSDHRWLIPGAMLLGGSFVLGCDLVARLIFAPYELPVGILLSFIGGPFFIYLLIHQASGKADAQGDES